MLSHGGDTLGFEAHYGLEPLDFSVNINPLGLSPKAREAFLQSEDRACCYPDPLSRRLREAISAHENVDAGKIVCSSGAAEIIWRLCLALKPRRALVTAPCFSEYESALSFAGCRVERHLLQPEDGFLLGRDILPKFGEADIVFLCNPNNPTGLCVEDGLLREILLRCRENGSTVVVDECFLGFLPDAEVRSVKALLGSMPGLVILKAFTKLYGMAGLRLGYALCGSADTAEAIRTAGQCWAVSTAAEEAGIAALSDREFVEKTLRFLPPERERLRAGLESLGLRVWPGEANFLFFHCEMPGFAEALGRRGILIRSCDNFPGLESGGYYRAAVLTGDKNDRLLAAIREAME